MKRRFGAESKFLHCDGSLSLDAFADKVVAVFRASDKKNRVLITDEDMGSIEGKYLARALKEKAADLNIICVVYTGRDHPEITRQAFPEIAGVLMKPVSTEKWPELILDATVR
jgi:FixJ family two-component response regulator